MSKSIHPRYITLRWTSPDGTLMVFMSSDVDEIQAKVQQIVGLCLEGVVHNLTIEHEELSEEDLQEEQRHAEELRQVQEWNAE